MPISKSLQIFIIAAVSIAITSSYHSGLVSYDEVWAYNAIKSYIAFISSLDYATYHDIYSNAEYYGVLDRVLPFLLFLVQRLWLFGHGNLDHITQSNLSDWIVTGYTSIQHLFNILIFLLGGYFVYRISKHVYAKSRSLATYSYFLFPPLLGHAVFNYKDIFIATAYTGFTLNLLTSTTDSLQGSSFRRFVSALISAVLCSQKIVLFLPLLITHVFWEILCTHKTKYTPRKYLREAASGSLGYVLMVSLLWYLLTPAAWFSPITFINESFSLFADFDQGGGCTYLLGYQFCLRANPVLVAPYILGWILSHSPLHILLGYLACIAVSVVYLLGSRQHHKSLSLFNPILFVVLQATLVPIFSILKGSNLYDADRHLLFVYPALITLSCAALLLAINRLKERYEIWCTRALSTYLIVLSLNIVLLSPYQYIYFNEIARPFVSHKNTSLDYWATSSREMMQNLILHGWLPLKPPIRSHEPEQLIVEPPPLAYALRSLGGEITQEKQSYGIFLEYRSPDDFDKYTSLTDFHGNECQVAQEVLRSQLLFPPLLLSRSILCKPHVL